MDRWATFDCYGTLIDWDTGLRQVLARFWPDRDPDLLLARYHEIEPRLQEGRAIPYRDVMAGTLERLARGEGLVLAPEDRGALGDSLPRWPAFPEAPAALRGVRERGWRIGILSNTDPDLLAASVRHLGVEPDLLVTAVDAGSYKPDHGHWNAFWRVSGADRSGHVHVAASWFHDLAPCAQLGVPAVWINRLGEVTNYPRAAELPDLTAVPEVLDQVVAGG